MLMLQRHLWLELVGDLDTEPHDYWEPSHVTVGKRYTWNVTAQSHLLPSKIKYVQDTPKEVITYEIKLCRDFRPVEIIAFSTQKLQYNSGYEHQNAIKIFSAINLFVCGSWNADFCVINNFFCTVESSFIREIKNQIYKNLIIPKLMKYTT